MSALVVTMAPASSALSASKVAVRSRPRGCPPMWFLSLAGFPLVCIGWSPAGVTVAWLVGPRRRQVGVAGHAGRVVPREGWEGDVGLVDVALPFGRGGDTVATLLQSHATGSAESAGLPHAAVGLGTQTTE